MNLRHALYHVTPVLQVGFEQQPVELAVKQFSIEFDSNQSRTSQFANGPIPLCCMLRLDPPLSIEQSNAQRLRSIRIEGQLGYWTLVLYRLDFSITLV